MEITIIEGLFGIFLLVIGAFINHLLSRKKYNAEINKINAEIKKINLDYEISSNDYQTTHSYNEEEIVERILERINKRENNKNIRENNWFTPPTIDEKILYILKVKLDFEKTIREIVINVIGGWSGCSMSSTYLYLEYAEQFKIFPESFFNEYFDFIQYSNYQTYSDSIQDDSFYYIQNTASNINRQLTERLESSIIENKSKGNPD
jgi:hypothetical protein